MDTLSELMDFHDRLTRYRNLVVDDSTDRKSIQRLRAELQRIYSRQGDAITEYSGKEPTVLGVWAEVNVFEEALEPYGLLDRTEKIDLLDQCLMIIDKAIGKLEAEQQSWKPPDQGKAFVDLNRIEELRAIKSTRFDLAKVIMFCEELNLCYKNKCYLAVSLLTRALLDHVPPIFDCSQFSEVANNYGGTKSFKKSMQNLEKSSRNIADAHLHTPIRDKETLPSRAQVDFSNDVDVLLSEVVRILK